MAAIIMEGGAGIGVEAPRDQVQAVWEACLRDTDRRGVVKPYVKTFKSLQGRWPDGSAQDITVRMDRVIAVGD